MERRHFLKLAVGIATGAAALAAAAQAAPLSPQPLGGNERLSPENRNVQSAVTTEAEVAQLKPEEVHWGHHGHGHHGGWHHRHWGWRHRRWGWHRHHWRHWHRRHW